uniref:Fe2OG dioxygenase domain-containing protein n=1 Tax=Naja naja TaxID=35670 RepID=A0A8C6XFL8_NAJNA
MLLCKTFPLCWVFFQPAHRRLSCSYETNRSPWLILQPLKKEILHPRPELALYHDFLSPFEAEKIKALAAPGVSDNGRLGAVEGFKYFNYRSSWIFFSAWLKDSLDPVVGALGRRAAAITGLNIQHPYAEYLQVVNYGLGGHYEPHFDHATVSKPVAGLLHGRIAFPCSEAKNSQAGPPFLPPPLLVSSKNAALFWWNLRKNGQGDEATLHAGCPVLAGDKWVANKWFHEHGQEFHRRCSTHPEE